MTTTAHALPDGWSIRIHPVMNILTLTLADENGTERQHGYHMKAPTTPAPETVHRLDDIADGELRASVQDIIDTYFDRLARLHRNCDAFSAAVPDWHALVAQLRLAVPDCHVDSDLDHDALSVIMTLKATGPAAGKLLALLATWPGSASDHSERSAGFDRDLDDDGTLTARFGQEHAIAFLTWLRTQR